jgi:hypothetical protein
MEIGLLDITAGAIKLPKWSVIVLHTALVMSFPIENWITVFLLAAVETEGIRRFLVESTAICTTPLLVCDTYCTKLTLTLILAMGLYRRSELFQFS